MEYYGLLCRGRDTVSEISKTIADLINIDTVEDLLLVLKEADPNIQIRVNINQEAQFLKITRVYEHKDIYNNFDEDRTYIILDVG